MALGIETGGFQLPQMQVAPADYSALAGMRPLQFGASAQSPLVFQPTQQWQVPSAKPELVAQGIAEGASNALKTISAVYLDEQKAKREDAQLTRKLEAETAKEKLKFEQDLKLQEIKNRGELERAKIIHGGKGVLSDLGLGESDIASFQAAADELKEMGRIDEAEAIEGKIRQATNTQVVGSRLEAVLPAERTKETVKLQPFLRDAQKPVQAERPKLEGAEPVDFLLSSGPSPAEALRAIDATSVAPDAERILMRSVAPDAERILMRSVIQRPAVPGAIDAGSVLAGSQITATPFAPKGEEIAPPQAKAVDLIPDDVRKRIAALASGAALTGRERQDVEAALRKSFDAAPDASAIKKQFEIPDEGPARPTRDIVDTVYQNQRERESVGKTFSKGTPFEKGIFYNRNAAQLEANREYMGYGKAEIKEHLNESKGTRYYTVERKGPDEKLALMEKKSIQSGLSNLQSQFKSDADIKLITAQRPALSAFIAGYEEAQKGGPAAKIADIELVDQYIKVMKGGLVTESQYAQVTGGEGMGFFGKPDYLVKMLVGGKLTPVERQAMANTLFAAANRGAENVNNYISRLRNTLKREYPGIPEENMPHYFPTYKTSESISKEMDSVLASMNALAQKGRLARDSGKDDEANLIKTKLTELAAKNAEMRKEKEEAEKSGAIIVTQKYRDDDGKLVEYPFGWPPYFGRGVTATSVTEQAE